MDFGHNLQTDRQKIKQKQTSTGDSRLARLLTVNTFMDNCDLKVPKLPLLT